MRLRQPLPPLHGNQNEKGRLETSSHTIPIRLQPIGQRAKLMLTSDDNPVDLTDNLSLGFNNLTLSRQNYQHTLNSTTLSHQNLQDDTSKANLSLGVGFLNFDQVQHIDCKLFALSWFLKPELLNSLIMGILQSFLQRLNIWQHCKIYGYEVMFPIGYDCSEGCVAGLQPAIIKSKEALLEWAAQVCMDIQTVSDDAVRWSIIVRLSKKDGSCFDTSFRTNEERIAEQRFLDTGGNKQKEKNEKRRRDPKGVRTAKREARRNWSDCHRHSSSKSQMHIPLDSGTAANDGAEDRLGMAHARSASTPAMMVSVVQQSQPVRAMYHDVEMKDDEMNMD